MKTKVFILVLLFITFPVLATNTLSVGLCNSRVSEILDNDNGLVSRLDWDEIITLNTKFSSRININSFILDLGVVMSVPNGFGIIRDYDFNDKHEIYQYSQHENHLDKNLKIAFDLGYEFKFKNFRVLPTISILYQNKKYSAWNGYKMESKNNNALTFEEQKQYIIGNGMSYEQQIISPKIKLELGYKLKKDFSFSGCFEFSSLVFADCIDSHYVRSKQFYDQINGGVLLGGNITVFYKNLAFSVCYEYIKTLQNGKTYQSNIGVGNISNTPVEGYFPSIESSLFSINFGYLL